MNLLKPEGKSLRKNPIREELVDFIVKGKMTGVTLKFFTEELYGLKILQRLDENSQLVLQNILEEVTDKILPLVERTLLLLSELRGLVRAKQLQFGGPNQTAQMYFGLNEQIVQKLVDFAGYYYLQAQMLAHDIVDAKINVRNMLVYFNHIVLKIAVNNPTLQPAG